jgi:hypothetical protein
VRLPRKPSMRNAIASAPPKGVRPRLGGAQWYGRDVQPVHSRLDQLLQALLQDELRPTLKRIRSKRAPEMGRIPRPLTAALKAGNGSALPLTVGVVGGEELISPGQVVTTAVILSH